MKFTILLLSLLPWSISTAALSPGTKVIEAETIANSGDETQKEGSARQGAYAFSSHPWNPVVSIAVPAGSDALTLWARLRGGPFLAKGTPGGQQQDLTWDYEKPTEWTWHKFGTYTREKLGEKILIIRGAELTEKAGIDTVVLTDDAGFNPRTLDDKAAPAPPDAGVPAAPAGALPPITVPKGGWFPPGWVPRRTAFRDSLAADQGAVVFVGDSITQGFHNAEAFPGLKTANRGIVGDLAGNLKHRLKEDVIDVNPRAVVILMGCNDAKDGRPADKIVDSLREAAEQIHTAHPEIPVILCRLMPRSPRPGQANEAAVLPGAILEVNKLIDQLPTGRPWLHLADPFTPMAQADGMPIANLFGDGVHPNAAGNAKFKEALEPALHEAGILK